MAYKNLAVLHKSGRIVAQINFDGPALDAGIVAGFAVSVANFARSLLGTEIRELCSQTARLTFAAVGEYVFLCQADLTFGSLAIQRVLKALQDTLVLLFGSHDKWDADVFNLHGAQVPLP